MDVVKSIVLIVSQDMSAIKSINKAVSLARYHGADLTIYSVRTGKLWPKLKHCFGNKHDRLSNLKFQKNRLEEQLSSIPYDINIVFSKRGLILGTIWQLLRGKHDMVVFAVDDYQAELAEASNHPIEKPV